MLSGNLALAVSFGFWCDTDSPISPNFPAQIPELFTLGSGWALVTGDFSLEQTQHFSGKANSAAWGKLSREGSLSSLVLRNKRGTETKHEPFTAQGCWSNFQKWLGKCCVPVPGRESIHWPLHSGKSLHSGIWSSVVCKLEVIVGFSKSTLSVYLPLQPVKDKNEDTIISCPSHVSSRETLLYVRV